MPACRAQGPPGMVVTLGVSPLLLPALLCGPAASNLLQEAGAGGEEVWNNGCFGTTRVPVGDKFSGLPALLPMAPLEKSDLFLEQTIGGRPGPWRPPRESESSEASDADFCVGKLGSGRQQGACEARGPHLPSNCQCRSKFKGCQIAFPRVDHRLFYAAALRWRVSPGRARCRREASSCRSLLRLARSSLAQPQSAWLRTCLTVALPPAQRNRSCSRHTRRCSSRMTFR